MLNFIINELTVCFFYLNISLKKSYENIWLCNTIWKDVHELQGHEKYEQNFKYVHVQCKGSICLILSKLKDQFWIARQKDHQV